MNLKKLKKYTLVVLSFFAILSCEEDPFIATLFESPAPEDIDNEVVVSEDNSGLVTVTPKATRAISYEIFFSEVTDEEPVQVGLNGQATYTYSNEGTYTVRVVAIGTNGKTTEKSFIVNVALTAIINFDSGIMLDESNPSEVTFNPIADNTASFDILFGDDPNETPTTVNPGEGVTHTYPQFGAFTATFTANSDDGKTAEFTEMLGTDDPLVLPIDFESTTLNYQWNGFGAADFGPIPAAIISNPDPSGINTSTTVTEIHKTAGAQPWAGASFKFSEPIDLSKGSTVKIKVWSPRVGTRIAFKVEDSTSPLDANNSPSIAAEVVVNSTVAMAWEELTYDLTTDNRFITSASYDGFVIFPDLGTMGNDEKFYVDDVIQEAGTVVNTDGLKFPMDFESSTLTYNWGSFGGVDVAVIANPDPTGVNTSANVTELHKTTGAQVWAGANLALDAPINFSKGTTVKVKVWSPRIGVPISFKIEDTKSTPDVNGNPTVVAEVTINTTVAMAWEELTYDLTTDSGFNTSEPYDKFVIFPDNGSGGNDEKFYVDDIIQTGALIPTLDSLEFPMNFESSVITYPWGSFGGVDVAVIANPDATGINTSANVTELHKTAGAQVWAGANLGLDGPIDFSKGTTFKIKVWSPRVGVPISFKIEDTKSTPDVNGNPTVVAEVTISTTVAMAWEELTYDLTTDSGFTTSEPYDKFVIFPDNGTGGNDEKFYIDDIIQE